MKAPFIPQIMQHEKQIFQGFVLALEVILAIFVFLYPTEKPIPVGVDAGSYITDARWISNNKTIPSAYESTYYNYSAYVSPLTSVFLTAAHQVTGLEITYPLFSVYQIFLIVLLVLSSFMVGRLYSSSMAALFPVIVIASFSVIRLFMGSTVANLLAFSFMNMGYVVLFQYFHTKRTIYLFLLGLFTIFTFLTHSYLSAPFFIVVIFSTFIIAIICNSQFRHGIWSRFSTLRRYWQVLILGIIVTLGVSLSIVYLPIVREAITAFVKTNIATNFRMPIPIRQYRDYLGQWLFTFTAFGLGLYILRVRQHFRSHTIFPLVWAGLTLAVLQTYRLGVSFFFERILLLGGISGALFAAYFFVTSLKKLRVGRVGSTIILGLFLSVTLRSGVMQVHSLYTRSNLVTDTQVVALQKLRDSAPANTVVYSHTNGASQTAHDVMVSERHISHFSTYYCERADENCQAFNDPMNEKSKRVFIANGVQYFLFMKPSEEGNEILDRLIRKYRFPNYSVVYQANDVWLFQMK